MHKIICPLGSEFQLPDLWTSEHFFEETTDNLVAIITFLIKRAKCHLFDRVVNCEEMKLCKILGLNVKLKNDKSKIFTNNDI